ncbi:hypothetical protein Agub_g13703 [Astrephomene gubernaculifera]|uniref:Uncharacterized protein n=1 Tax=Astrephomene gubernaculifera TaxID=47775 RepID=A0AAD3E0F4_9CHLO|nr:hypothetical protein Agub_g13703 [Astrephomene gubernaculifera]
MIDQTPTPPPRSRSTWTPSAFGRAVTDFARQRPKPAKRRRAATDELKLFCMGYRQELARKLTLFNNAGVAFSLLTPLTALTGTYGTWGLLYGGPVVMMWGFPIVSLFSLLVAVSLAELASAYPTSGATYYWTWVLAPPRFKALCCWLNGWLMLLGQGAFTAASSRMFTDMLDVFVLMATGKQLPNGILIAVFIVVLLGSALAAGTSNSVTAYLTSLSAFWNLVALAALAVALPAVAPKRQSASYMFTCWTDASATTGVQNHFYNLLLGLLMSQYVYLGFDSSAHISEETQHAEINAPRGMLAASLTAAVTGYGYLLSLNACTVDPAALLSTKSESRGKHAAAQLFWNVHADAYHDGRGGLALLTVPMISALMCTYQCVSANARMLFAFSRDGAVPLSRYLGRVEKRTRAPAAAAWAMALLGVVLGVPMYFAAPYVNTISTLAIVNTYLSYGLPILCKLVSGRSAFLPGPFFTGRRISRAINLLALLWVLVIAVIFSLPTAYPLTGTNMNYNAAAAAAAAEAEEEAEAAAGGAAARGRARRGAVGARGGAAGTWTGTARGGGGGAAAAGTTESSTIEIATAFVVAAAAPAAAGAARGVNDVRH